MINYISYKIRQSTLKTWVALSLFHDVKNKSSLKQRCQRAIKFMNKTLKPLGLEVWVREIGSGSDET